MLRDSNFDVVYGQEKTYIRQNNPTKNFQGRPSRVDCYNEYIVRDVIYEGKSSDGSTVNINLFDVINSEELKTQLEFIFKHVNKDTLRVLSIGIAIYLPQNYVLDNEVVEKIRSDPLSEVTCHPNSVFVKHGDEGLNESYNYTFNKKYKYIHVRCLSSFEHAGEIHQKLLNIFM